MDLVDCCPYLVDGKSFTDCPVAFRLPDDQRDGILSGNAPGIPGSFDRG
jgi:hypothetical protein